MRGFSASPLTRILELNCNSAKARYAELGVDTDAAMAALAKIPISLHCWQWR